MLQALSHPTSLPREEAASWPEVPRIDWVDPLRALGFLRRHATIIVAATGAALLLGLCYAALTPSRYRSAAELLIDPRGLQILKNEVTRSSDTTDGALVDIENQRYVILSRSILEAAVNEAHLADSPLFGAAPAGLLSRTLSFLHIGAPAADRTERAISALGSAIDVVRGERAYIIDIVVTTADPTVSAEIANTIAHVYLEREAAARAQAARRAGRALTERADELRHDVEQAESEVETFRARSNLPVGAQGQLLGSQQLGDLNYQLALARGRTAEAEAKITQLDQMNRAKVDPGNLPEAIQSPVIQTLRAQYARLVQQEGSLTMELGPRHPALIQLQQQMRQVRGLIVAEIDRIAQAAHADVERAKANEAALQRSLDMLSESNGSNAPALVRLHELERAADAKRTIYEAVLGRSKELEEQQGLDTGNTRIISDAVPALKSSGAPLALVLAGAMVFGLGAGVAGAYLYETFGIRVRSQAALDAITGGLPVLAVYRDGATPGTSDLEASGSLLGRLCSTDAGGRARLIAVLGLRHDPLRAPMLDEIADAAHRDGVLLKRVSCTPDAASDAASTYRRPRRDTISIVDLLRDDVVPPTQRRLRQSLIRFGGDSDIVLLDTPPLLDVGMPPALVQAADAVVLVLAASDLDRPSLETLLAHVEASAVPAIGIILDGEIDLA